MAAAVAWYARQRVQVECALAHDRSYDRAGAALWSCALIALLIGASTLPTRPGIILVAAGSVLLSVFIGRERRAPSPLLDPGLFRRPCFGLGNAAAFLFYAGSFAPSFLLSLYLQEIAGYDARSAGLLLVLSPVAMALLSRPAGQAAGVVLTGIALALLTTLSIGTDLLVVGAVLVLVGAGPALFAAPVLRLVLEPVERDRYAVASSTEESMRLVGQTLALGSAAAVFALRLGAVPAGAAPPGLLLDAMRSLAWLELGLVAASHVVLLLLRPEPAPQGTRA